MQKYELGDECMYLCNPCMLKELPSCCVLEEDDTPDSPDDPCADEPDDDPDVDVYGDFHRKGIHFIHINARSIRHKMTDLKIIAEKSKAGIIAISESWFDSSITDAEVSMPGYNLERKDRNTHGGGVCMYIREDLSYNPRSDLDHENLEAIWIDLLLKKTKPILIGCVYRPPDQRNFCELFQDTLSNTIPSNETIILGDMNIDTKRRCPLVKKYISVLKSNGLKQIVNKPTRPISSSLIDHILVSDDVKITQCNVMPVGFSDHCLVYCTRKVSRDCIRSHNFVTTRSLRHYSKEVLVQKLHETNWETVYACNDVNIAWKRFEFMFCSIIDKLAPKRLFRAKVRSEPWVTSEIIESLHDRDKCLKKYLTTKHVEHKRQFNVLRNKAQRLVKKARSEYILNEIEKNRNCSKKMWDSLKLLGYKQKAKTKEQIVLNVNNNICYDPVTIAEYINDFFVNVANNLIEKLPCYNDIYSAFSNKCKEYYSNLGVTPGMFALQEVDNAFVLKHLRDIKPNKSTGLDDISPRFLHDGAEQLSNVITYMINLSIKNKTVPDCTKHAKVTPIHKKKSKLEIGNYRPVSVLPAISKLLERAVLVQVESFCKEHSLLYEFQSGFRGNFSTDTCLIYLHDYIRSQISKGKFVGLLMLDVQKAFDSVNHNMLCEKIKLAGIDNTWFRSYLEDRKQVVSVNDYTSNVQSIVCGVPQGSILGPWCYLMFCNDMSTCVSCNLILYADDAILLSSHCDIKQVIQDLSMEVSNCHHWLTNNKLSMHMGKTEAIILCSKRKRNLLKNVVINCKDQSIEPSDEVKYLGLKLDSTLSGDSTVSCIINKCMSRLKFLYRNADALDFKSRKLIVSALIQCHFDYGVSAWFWGLTKGAKKKLQVAQNKVVRFVLDLGPRSHIGQCELDRAGLLNVIDRAKQLMLNHMFNIYHQTAPYYLCQNFTRIDHGYRTRYMQNNFYIRKPNVYERNNFNYQGPLIWNALPNNVKSITSKNLFKAKVKQFLRTQAHLNEA